MECLESLKIVESVTLRFEGRDTAEAIQNPAKDWNPESEFHWKRISLSSSRNPESMAWNPLSKTVFVSLT